MSAVPPDGLQLGRTRTPTLHYERNALPAKLLALGVVGLEPTTFRIRLQSNALTNSATLLLPPKGFEPLSSDYKTDILPFELRRHSFASGETRTPMPKAMYPKYTMSSNFITLAKHNLSTASSLTITLLRLNSDHILKIK